MPDRPRTPDDVRVAVDRALRQALPADADPWEAPRELAVHVALTEGLTVEDALARCGVRLRPPPRGPAPVAFGRLPYGAPFRLGGLRYRKVNADAARRMSRDAPNAVPLDRIGAAVRVPPDRLVQPTSTSAP